MAENLINIDSWKTFSDWFEVKNKNGVNYFSGYAQPSKAGITIAALFYSPSCGWCKKFDPVFIEAAAQNPQVVHLRINIAKLQGLMDILNAQGIVVDAQGNKRMDILSPLPIEGVPVLASFAPKIEIDRKNNTKTVVTKYFSKFGGERTVPNVVQYVATIGKPGTKVAFIPSQKQ